MSDWYGPAVIMIHPGAMLGLGTYSSCWAVAWVEIKARRGYAGYRLCAWLGLACPFHSHNTGTSHRPADPGSMLFREEWSA